MIGTVYNASIISEFSKIEIGEIREGTSITDFNSTYWFYNWSGDFKKFDMQAEYSKVNMFKPNKSIGSPNNYRLLPLGTIRYTILETVLLLKFNPIEIMKKPRCLAWATKPFLQIKYT